MDMADWDRRGQDGGKAVDFQSFSRAAVDGGKKKRGEVILRRAGESDFSL
jgi:hypothetical protein